MWFWSRTSQKNKTHVNKTHALFKTQLSLCSQLKIEVNRIQLKLIWFWPRHSRQQNTTQVQITCTFQYTHFFDRNPLKIQVHRIQFKIFWFWPRTTRKNTTKVNKHALFKTPFCSLGIHWKSKWMEFKAKSFDFDPKIAKKTMTKVKKHALFKTHFSAWKPLK